MARSYNRLWHKLIDLNMSKSEMRRKAGLTTNALAKLGKGESVPLETLEKICNALDCRIEDIVECVRKFSVSFSSKYLLNLLGKIYAVMLEFLLDFRNMNVIL